MKKMSRRQFLEAAGLTAGAALLGGCTPPATPVPSPGASPTAAAAGYIAYCGLDCAGVCDQYANKTCAGCLSREGVASYCAACPVRQCGQAQALTNCAHCADYPDCQKLNTQYAGWGSAYAASAEAAKAALAQVHAGLP